jgi:hypothetical protein
MVFIFNLTDNMAMNMISHSGYVNVGPRSPIRSGTGKSVSSKKDHLNCTKPMDEGFKTASSHVDDRLADLHHR